jgi:hypothetical protein
MNCFIVRKLLAKQIIASHFLTLREKTMSKTYEQKLIHYATAPRATAGKLTQYIDGDFVTYWVGRLRGVFVKIGDDFKFDNKADALALARRYREECVTEAKMKGLIAV